MRLQQVQRVSGYALGVAPGQPPTPGDRCRNEDGSICRSELVIVLLQLDIRPLTDTNRSIDEKKRCRSKFRLASIRELLVMPELLYRVPSASVPKIHTHCRILITSSAKPNTAVVSGLEGSLTCLHAAVSAMRASSESQRTCQRWVIGRSCREIEALLSM
ncbi:hypothetical protein BDV11DRAFT_182965 [Aspergillus similis]